MTIKYVGPKPIISHRGIEFDTNKEDKYVYLNIAVQLIKALDHHYFENKTYTYDIGSIKLSDEQIIETLKKYNPNLDKIMDKENHDIENEINENLLRANENDVLDKNSKEVLENNIKIMHDYLVQRSINKSVYYVAIEILAELVKKDHIDYIITPMYYKFLHVLHSVQGVLRKQKTPIDTDLEIYEDGDKLFIKLKVINIVQ